MDKKRWSCSFLSVNTLIHRIGALLAVSTLLVLGTSTPVMAKCNDNGTCEQGENVNNCSADCLPGPPGGGGLTANLTGGTFVFANGPISVNLNPKETTLRSNEDVYMTRPTETDLQGEWDAVFGELGGGECVFLPQGQDPQGQDVVQVPGLIFGDDSWEIYVNTGHMHVTMGGNIDEDGIHEHEEEEPHNPSIASIGLHLEGVGLDSYDDVPLHLFPPGPDQIAQFCLDQEYWVNFTSNTVRGRRGICTAVHYPPGFPSTLTICAKDVDCDNPPELMSCK